VVVNEPVRHAVGCLAALALLAACDAHTDNPHATSTSPVSTTSSVGDCLADPPPSDPSVVNVSVVDCALTHAAEVYQRSNVQVNAAVADVADRECDTGFARYTGQSVGGGPLVVTYLIDSNQDRTSADPLPSTVICLLQASNGGPLTGSARR
jgi:hypothetical protein